MSVSGSWWLTEAAAAAELGRYVAMATIAKLRTKLSAAGIPPELHGKFVEFQEKYGN